MSEQTAGHPGAQRKLAVRESSGHADAPAAIEARDFNFYYGDFRALEHISMVAPRHQITALIGPSGAGKSTLLRAMNRMHDETPGTSSEGDLLLDGEDINGIEDLIVLRKRVGMIFQRPNPFPMSIFENVAYGLRLKSQSANKGVIADQVEQALRGAAIWDEVKDKLQQSGLALSGGQQQRLCIARAIAVEPEVLLMDEPCAALDPIATLKIEELMAELEERYTIVIVTHNLQQAGRVADQTVFLSMNPETRAGFVVEAGPTQQIFTNPKDDRTLAYISGRFG
ncbi:phosphate ABC transporter ATP-binding protein [Chloroflexales bacterium ZM16-3]|nr:phosphate ABC transporter ATP-binding protein [Chloroflexales bacterium ZM16-3]